ncbi:MAG TPA: N(4)-(beta-N-acetylglucosaminyl)-L-asparaginase [Chitinophagaceae bacterium]|nr:N(4)-(beta-N-acetylglucosaminyl)-L-asparaginase [Chitinophagaceae bacterium]
MFSRRNFLQKSTLGSLALFLDKRHLSSGYGGKPVVLSTWGSNTKASDVAWSILKNGGAALDAVEKGVRITEADPTDQSVGYGGLPDRNGKVTLDACIMDENGNCGAVMALEHIMHPVSVARLVMERTPHVQLVGNGALAFALEQGFKRENLLTSESKQAWKEWLKKSQYNPNTTIDNIQKKKKKATATVPNHDTIGMIALDARSNLSGACSTSGLAYKMHGRVGDSPVIGAGLFVDNEVGAATATGVGEEVVRICGAHTVVELMRQGIHPEEACRRAIERIVKRKPAAASGLQVGFIAVNKEGVYGAYAVSKGVDYVVQDAAGAKLLTVKSWFA